MGGSRLTPSLCVPFARRRPPYTVGSGRTGSVPEGARGPPGGASGRRRRGAGRRYGRWCGGSWAGRPGAAGRPSNKRM
ncbi:Hypothetical protein SCLAV_2952 [Streptomyces clavuligerus]|uniref:Uncharacterized protein n=1 Tax=Streptomyces clavuligerus TaxID=1901 RepID=E2PWM4_STRCL|nr:Hypothetical protein SCLAV_2952 [Streptomyces clavuligerus]